MNSIHNELDIIRRKKKIERDFETYFENKGFALIEPKAFQSYDTYLLSNSRQDLSKTVKVLGGNSNIFILRPDITSNILTGIFSKWDRTSPLQVYYNSKIFQNGPGGDIQENYQMGIESLGYESASADLQILEMVGAIMEKLGEPYLLELGTSQFLDALLAAHNLEFSQETELRKYISSKDRQGLEGKLAEFQIEDPLFAEILDLEGDMADVLERAKALPLNERMEKALITLEALQSAFVQANLLAKTKLDLAMVGDLDYYDGIIFKGYCPHIPRKILSGGRYDRFTERFGQIVPAIGFMVDMDLVTRIRVKEDETWKR